MTDFKDPQGNLTPHARQQLLADLVGGMSARAAADKWLVLQATVSRLAREAGLKLADPLDDIRQQRERIKLGLLEDVERLRERAWSGYSKTILTREGPMEIFQPLPPLGEVKAAYNAIGTALSGYARLEELDADQTAGDRGVSLVDQLMAGLAAVADELEGREERGEYGPEDPLADLVGGELALPAPDGAAGGAPGRAGGGGVG